MFVNPQANKRILVIDDDREIWKAYEQVLAPGSEDENSSLQRINRLLDSDAARPEDMKSFVIDFAAQGQDGFGFVETALAKGEPYAVTFVDVRMPPGWDGMETAARIRRIDPNIEIVIVTAYSDRSREEIARAVGASDKLLFIRKPFDAEELLQLAVSLSDKWQITRDEARHRTHLQTILRTSPAAIFTIDQQGCITSWNPAAENITGYAASEVVGKPCIFHEIADDISCLKCLSGPDNFEPASNCQISIRNKEGLKKELVINLDEVPGESDPLVALIGSFWDMTEMMALEEERRQSQKLNALGNLAGGIAHDLNNILTPIFGYTYLGLQQTEKGSSLHEKLQVIDDCAKKAADLIRQILAFTCKQSLKMASTDINGVINDFTKMLRRLIREDISLNFDLEDDLWPVMADRSQLEQILLNLIVNARDALVDRDVCGAITIRTAKVSLDPDSCYDITHQALPGGDYVLLLVADQGTGMSKDVLEQIFDPFFTTKEVGKGTGLGLSTLFGIVRQHKGSICVKSAPNQGSEFQIYFPRYNGLVVVDEQRPMLTVLDQGQQETLLVVEDNATVRGMLTEALGGLNYTLLTAENGRKGLEVFTNHEGDIDLIITDMIMPVMGGQAMADKVWQRYPELPILFMTGHAFDAKLSDIASSPHSDYIQKPLNMKDVAEMIRDMLARAAQRQA
ncbi:MAG: response regulator [Proteobacteria bacterium]|nr:response regulator [Pseudomonadota bacterium]MBU1640038.1 response regulator [Pseudomonadota bacterium]